MNETRWHLNITFSLTTELLVLNFSFIAESGGNFAYMYVPGDVGARSKVSF